MAETVEYRKLRVEFNRHLKMIRGHAAAAKLFIESGDLVRAYDEAEKIQMVGFDAKDLLGKLVQKQSIHEDEPTYAERLREAHPDKWWTAPNDQD